jgi:hypothetical protein
MRTGGRVIVSVITGITVAAVAGGFALGADGSGRGLQNLLWNIFTMPGGASLKLSHGGASPVLKYLLGGGGPGPTALQMLLVSFVVWATLIGGLTFICLRARAARMI